MALFIDGKQLNCREMENHLSQALEEIECINMLLDSYNVPKCDGEEVYSYVGRIKLLAGIKDET